MIRLRRQILYAIMGWSLLRSSRPAAAQTPAATAAAEAQPQTDDDLQKLRLKVDVSSRMTVPVTIDGQGPFAFLIDTGSDRTVISRELAEYLKLPAGPLVTMHESTGVEEVTTVVVRRLRIGDRMIDRIEAPNLAEEDLGAQGLLGVDCLRDLHIVMDFETKRLSVSPSRPEPADPDTIVVTGRNRYGQLILVDARVRGVGVLVVLDSGAQLSVGNPALLRLLYGPNANRPARGQAEIVSVSGRRMTVELDDVSEANVGGLLIRNMRLAFAQLHTFDRFGLTQQPALLLGMDVMSKCRRVSVDLRRREATFTLD